MMYDFEVAMGESESPSDFYVKFVAPKDSQSEHNTRTHGPHTHDDDTKSEHAPALATRWSDETTSRRPRSNLNTNKHASEHALIDMNVLLCFVFALSVCT